MSEDFISLQIEEDDVNCAKNSNNIDEMGKNVLSEFEKFAHFWRSSVRVTNAILQYLQYKYCNELLFKQNLTKLASEDWIKYIDYWKRVCLVYSYILNDLTEIQTDNVLEKEQKNKDIKYLNDLTNLLRDVHHKKRNILTPLSPVPQLNLHESIFIKNKGDISKYREIFQNLLLFCASNYLKEKSSENFLKNFTILFKNILSRKRELDEFIRHVVVNQEDCNEDILQRWMELQQFLTSYFNNTSKQIQQNEPKCTKEAQKSSQFYLFLQSLLKKDEFKRTKEIHLFLNEHLYVILSAFYSSTFLNYLVNDVELVFLILLLDVKFDFKNCIKAHEATIQKTLTDNFLKEWRQILHVPITLLQFHQCQIHHCDLKENKSSEWATEKKNMVNQFRNMIEKITVYVINISIRMEILKSTSIKELSQLIQDSEYLNNLLKILQEIFKYKRDILFPIPPVPKLNILVAKHSSTNETESGLNDVVFNLYYLYELINKSPRKYFCEWNKEMLGNISKNLDTLNNFICDYKKNQYDEKDISLLWDEIKCFFDENKNIGNNVVKRRVKGQNTFAQINRLIFDRNRQWKVELQSILPNNFKGTVQNDKIYEMQIYIIILLNVTPDVGVFVKNSMNLNSNLIIIGIKIVLQLLLSFFKYIKVDSIILHLNMYVHKIISIINYMQLLIIECDDTKDFVIYNNLLKQFKNILHDVIKLHSTEVLEEIENIHKSISNLNNDENFIEKENVILWNLYCFWRMFIEKEDYSKENFFHWNKKMFYLLFMKLNEIDSIINKLPIENDRIVEMWNCFKKFLFKKFTELDEDDSNEINHKDFFESFLNDNSFFPKEIEFVLNFIKINDLNMSLKESEILFVFILFDSPCSLKQMANFVYEYNMLIIYDKLIFEKFIYSTILRVSNKNEIGKLNSFDFSRDKILIENLNKYLYAYHILSKNSLNIMNCLNEIYNNEIKNDFFCLNEVPQLPTEIFQLEMISNLFLMQLRQILYLYVYLKSTQIDELHGKSVDEKIQSILEYIYLNYEEMDTFVNNYLGHLENTSIFQSNWSLIKEVINKLSLEEFNNSWQLLNFVNCEKYLYKEYFEGYNLRIPELVMKINEKEAGQHVLLILLNVPLSQILKNQYKKQFTLDDLFSFMILYKKLLPNLGSKKQYILTHYHLTMNTFLVKLEYISNTFEGENESSKLLVKSEFNSLDKQEKIAIIENLLNIIHSQNKHGYFIIIFKILLSLLPLNDIFLDIILAIKFFFSNEMVYFGLTIGILLITGIATVITEIILNRKSEIHWMPTYYVKILNVDKLKYLLSFSQITFFLRALNEAWLRLKIRRKKNNSYLEYINYGDPEFLKKERQTLKYVEMCFEAIPQTILQLYIILIKNDSKPLQLLSIFSSICSAMVIVWSFISSRDPKNEPFLMNNRRLLLRELCFYGLRIINGSLILLIFSWPILIIWLVLRFLLDFTIGTVNQILHGIIYLYFNLPIRISSKDYKTNNYGLFNSIHSDLMDNKVYNILTVIEFFIAYFVFAFHLQYNSDNIYYGVLIILVYPIFLLTWTIILYLDNFVYSVNVTPTKRINFNEIFLRHRNRVCLICCKKKQSPHRSFSKELRISSDEESLLEPGYSSNYFDSDDSYFSSSSNS